MPPVQVLGPAPASHASMRAVLPIMAVVALFFLTIGMALPVLPLHVHEGLGFDTVVVGVIAGSSCSAIFPIAWGARRWRYPACWCKCSASG